MKEVKEVRCRRERDRLSLPPGGSVFARPLSAVFPSGIRLKPVASWDPIPAWLLSLLQL